MKNFSLLLVAQTQKSFNLKHLKTILTTHFFVIDIHNINLFLNLFLVWKKCIYLFIKFYEREMGYEMKCGTQDKIKNVEKVEIENKSFKKKIQIDIYRLFKLILLKSLILNWSTSNIIALFLAKYYNIISNHEITHHFLIKKLT